MDSERVTGPQEFLANDRTAVRVLASVESGEIRIVNCPESVRRWIAAERDWQGERLHRPGTQEPNP